MCSSDLPGGIPGTLNLEKSAVVKEAIRSAMEENRYVGAICAAPSILGHMGYLDDREITCYPGFETQMPKAYYTGERVVVSDHIVMGKGAGAAVDFALKLIPASLKRRLRSTPISAPHRQAAIRRAKNSMYCQKENWLFIYCAKIVPLKVSHSFAMRIFRLIRSLRLVLTIIVQR